MRTTLEIDDSVIAAAKAIARDEGVSLGTAISNLARRGLRAGGTTRTSAGFPVFSAAADADPITLDVVNEHRDD
jgi:hypothetical protein